MLEIIEAINSKVNAFIWGVPAIICIIGWGLYGVRCAEFVFSAKIVKPFMVVYSMMAIVGATIDLGLVWSISDTFNRAYEKYNVNNNGKNIAKSLQMH